METTTRQNDESLLDWMARQAACEYLSDLRRMTEWQRHALTQALARLSAEERERRQWNDALTYLFQDSVAQETAAAAKELLLKQLTDQRQQ